MTVRLKKSLRNKFASCFAGQISPKRNILILDPNYPNLRKIGTGIPRKLYLIFVAWLAQQSQLGQR